LLGSHPQPASQTATFQAGAGLDRLIQRIIDPSIVPGATAQQTSFLSAVDLELTSQLLPLLHHPAFQVLESTWRGLDFLVRHFAGAESIKLNFADISKVELAAELQVRDGVDFSDPCKLVSLQCEDQSWSVCLRDQDAHTPRPRRHALGRELHSR
jgi:predicted component of type VI protein secretion system